MTGVKHGSPSACLLNSHVRREPRLLHGVACSPVWRHLHTYTKSLPQVVRSASAPTWYAAEQVLLLRLCTYAIESLLVLTLGCLILHVQASWPMLVTFTSLW